MLDSQLNIKVADFGFLSSKEVEKHKTYMGTKAYLAPELNRIKSKE